jgi:hypothetical protein
MTNAASAVCDRRLVAAVNRIGATWRCLPSESARLVWRAPCASQQSVQFELRRTDTGGLVHRYDTEGAALAFVRDVVRVAGHQQAACFALDQQDSDGHRHAVAEGADLVERALQDRANL